MPRKALIKIRRGTEAQLPTLDVGELGFCTDTNKLYIGTSTGNQLLVAAQSVGDMLKSIYDTNDDGKVDAAEAADSVPWTGVTGKPSSYPPSSHTHPGGDITSKVNSAAAADSVPWSGVTGKPSTFPPSTQTVNWLNMDEVTESGFYYGYTMTNSAYSGISVFIVVKYSPDWIVQIQLVPASALQISLRARYNGTTWGPWVKVWNEHNDGSGSGLDADLLDGKHASDFAASSHNHGISNITGLQAVLDGKMPKGPITWNQLKGVI